MKGALRYHGADARRLGELLRVQTLSRLGVDMRVGIGSTITVAATASGRIDAPGGVLAVGPDQAAGSGRCRWRPCTASARSRPRCCGSTACTVSVCSPPFRRSPCSVCSGAPPDGWPRTGPEGATPVPLPPAFCLPR